MNGHVLLTRPAGENERLAAMLVEAGISVDIHPLIELSARPQSHQYRQTAMDVDQQDAVIFISKSAVRFALPILESYWPQWPLAPAWFAVGRGTAETLADHGIRADYPAVPGSEGLLELPGLKDVAEKKVLIVRGVGGREMLRDKLIDRGARVAYWEVYERRSTEDNDLPPLTDDMVVAITSLEMLHALVDQAGDIVSHLRLVTVSDRIADEASGFAEVSIAGGASDQALYDAIVEMLPSS